MAVKQERGNDPDGTPTGRLAENVVFHLEDDGLEPRKAPWGFILRNPMQVILAPKESRRIDLKVSADVPMLVWPTRAHTDNVKVDGSMIHPQATTVTCVVTNPSEHLAMEIADREPLVCASPIVYSGDSTVG